MRKYFPAIDSSSFGECGLESWMKRDNNTISFRFIHAVSAAAGQGGKPVGIDGHDDGLPGKSSGAFVEDPVVDGPFDKMQQVV